MFFKVCGMRRQRDLDDAAALGFALCGFIFHPSSPRGTTPAEAAALDSRGMRRVGVFVRQDAAQTLAAVRTAGLDLVQLHGGQDAACMAKLAGALGRERLVRVLWPQKTPDAAAFAAELEEALEHCGTVLLDAGASGGGHGRRLALESLPASLAGRRWILAGGLGPDVFADLAALPPERLPAGLDFNSGLESAPGAKDRVLMERTMAEARRLGMPPGPWLAD